MTQPDIKTRWLKIEPGQKVWIERYLDTRICLFTHWRLKYFNIFVVFVWFQSLDPGYYQVQQASQLTRIVIYYYFFFLVFSVKHFHSIYHNFCVCSPCYMNSTHNHFLVKAFLAATKRMFNKYLVISQST